MTGEFAESSPTTGDILHWDGSSWKVALHAPTALWGVWGSGPNDVWAVGGNLEGDHTNTTAALRDQGTILHWNGSLWSLALSDQPDGFGAVGGTGPRDVWVVGGAWDGNPQHLYPTGVALHWDGASWSRMPLDKEGGAIWASGPRDAWAVGSSGGIFHWDGTTWNDETCTIPPGGYLMDTVWGSGPNDVWIAGLGVPFLSSNPTWCDIFHFDGTTWQCRSLGYDPSMSEPSSGLIRGLWGTGPNDMYAVDESALLHWDGTSWTALWTTYGPAGH